MTSLVVVTLIMMIVLPGAAAGRAAPGMSWIQTGESIDGEARFDRFGASLAISSDGRHVVGGSSYNNDSARSAGHARVFRFDDDSWTQVGFDIDGESAYDRSGVSVAISSDGSRVAVGAFRADGVFPSGQRRTNVGHVRVFEFDGSAWTQLGSDIDGERNNDESGRAVSISDDGTRVAIGAMFNDGAGDRSGHVRVFDFDGSDWSQVGADIDGANPLDFAGETVTLSRDGQRVAVGAPRAGSGDPRGEVRVFEFDGSSWAQVGGVLAGDTPGDRVGTSLAMSGSGERIAIGSSPIAGAGEVRVFELRGAAWVQVGSEMVGNGYSTAMTSDGGRVVLSASSVGGARVFDFDGIEWVQTGEDIVGETGARLGSQVAISADGSLVVAASPSSDAGAASAGQVRAFELQLATRAPLADGDVVVLQNAASDRYLDADGPQHAWNVDTARNPRLDARWRLVQNADDTWSLLNRYRTRYLDADGVFLDFNVGQSVQQGADDRWVFLEQPDGTFVMQSVVSGRYLSQAAVSNTNVVTSDTMNDLARWVVIPTG